MGISYQPKNPKTKVPVKLGAGKTVLISILGHPLKGKSIYS
jgi:hypothetical protein